MSGELELRVVRVPSILTDPDLEPALERLRQAEERRRARLSPAELELEDRLAAEVDRRVLFGVPSDGSGTVGVA